MAFARLCWAPVELNLRPGPLTFTKRATRLPSRDEARRIAVNIAKAGACYMLEGMLTACCFCDCRGLLLRQHTKPKNRVHPLRYP